MRSSWAWLVCISAIAAPAWGQDAKAIDAWGRFVPAFDLAYKTVGKTWSYVPQGHFYVMAKGAESDDIITAQYFVAGKPFGDALKCPVTLEDLRGSDAKIAVTHECKPDLDKHGITRPATFTVKIGYKQVSAGKEFKDIGSYTFAVDGHAGPGGTKEFHVNYDFRMGEAWIHRLGDGQVNLFAWFKESSDNKTAASSGKMRCFVGDKKWEFAEMTNSRWSHDYDDYAGGKSGNKVRWTYQYFFPAGDNTTWLKENPGDYRCVYTRGGEAEREFFFSVKDGTFVKPKCQQGDTPHVVTPEATTIIKQVVKGGADLKHDAAAFGKAGLFGKGRVAEACGF